MEVLYCLVVAVANVAARVPIEYAQDHGKRADAVVLSVAALMSALYHLSPVVAPALSGRLLWADRVAAIFATVHFLYFFGGKCPYDVQRAFHATKVMGGLGLLALFLSDVVLGGEPSFVWCVLHAAWHVCAFLVARRLQGFIYRAK